MKHINEILKECLDTMEKDADKPDTKPLEEDELKSRLALMRKNLGL